MKIVGLWTELQPILYVWCFDVNLYVLIMCRTIKRHTKFAEQKKNKWREQQKKKWNFVSEHYFFNRQYCRLCDFIIYFSWINIFSLQLIVILDSSKVQ